MSWLRFDFKILAFLLFLWAMSLFLTLILPPLVRACITGTVILIVAIYIWKTTSGIVIIYKTNGYSTKDSKKVIIVDDVKNIGERNNDV